MNLCICYTRPDGDISIVHPAPNARLEGETDRQFAERIAAKDVPSGLPSRIIPKSDLPGDRVFREAWRDTGTAIVQDMPLCRGVRKAQLKALYDKAMAKHNEKVEKAVDDADPIAEAKARADRKKCRDRMLAIDAELAALATTAVLKAFAPAEFVVPE